MGVMTNIELANKVKDIANNYKTLYVYGCFGAPMNATNKNRYSHNYAYNEQSSRINKIRNASADTFGFDCVNLIKGVLWGWNGNVNATYGGARYASNGVPDTNANGMMNYCTGVSRDFSNIQVGEAVHMDGHIGIYIGDGLAVECTPIWKDGVQITAVGNIGRKSGYNTRTWTDHGKLKFVDYISSTPSNNNNTNNTSTKFNKGDEVIINGPLYKSSNAATPAGNAKNKKTKITRIASGAKHPYNTTGDLGWMDESSIQLVNNNPTPTPAPTNNPGQNTFITGNYKTNGTMYVRTGPGTNYTIKKVCQLTPDGRRNATSSNGNADAIYRAGTVFTAYEIFNNAYGVWARTPSGYVCIKGASGRVYCTKV